MLREADGPIFSFEFFPPKSPEGEEVLLETVGVLKQLGPSFVSVTYGAGGTTRDKTIEVVSRIRAEFELEAMPHLTCVNATVDDLRRTLDEMGEAGVENVLALRGDPPRGQERWTKTEGGLEYSRELVALARDEYDFAIGAAAFPETHIHASSADDDVRHLKAKVDAGATFLITQMFFDNRFYFDFVERAREAGVEVPIIPGVMPILSSDGIRRMAELSAAHLPPELVHELEARHGNDEAVADLGLSFATLQCAELLAGGAPGIHFCTLNRTPATRAVLSALQLMRPWGR
ncbi:MAG: methylenetetrahydrofolate reductase [NAD(P)H] [Thermoleophilaceae bacterium]